MTGIGGVNTQRLVQCLSAFTLNPGPDRKKENTEKPGVSLAFWFCLMYFLLEYKSEGHASVMIAGQSGYFVMIAFVTLGCKAN